MKKSLKKGFSIAEIVVVIGVMALLTTLIYTSLDGSKRQSRDQKRVAEISSVRLALEEFYARNKYYPGQLSSIVPQYLSVLPTEAKYAPLKYNADDANCGFYHLYTTLESKISVLDSKKGFDSTNKEECVPSAETINALASGNELVYDVTP